MLCPGIIRQGHPWPCGQCQSCRINRRRIWETRLLLESTQHECSYFVTLTYDPEHLPAGGTLVPSHLQLWLHRFRKALAPARIRFFAVGEYGETTLRPHYHAIVFGAYRPDLDRIVQSTWGKGHVHVGLAAPGSFRYVAGYVMKGYRGSSSLPEGLHPEFTRSSRRPGIGGDSVNALAQALNASILAAEVGRRGDVLSEVRMDGQTRPLGRYVRGRLRSAAGYPEVDPIYRLGRLQALLDKPLETAEERRKRKLESLHRARNHYRNRRSKAKL